MSTPRIKSKLSILCYDSSDMDKRDTESLCPREPSNDELDSTAKKAAPSNRKTTISRLSFPFVKSAKSPPSKAVKSSSPPSTAPSQPVSAPIASSKRDMKPSSPPVTPLPFPHLPHCNPQRHNYRHRGYSRHALAHIKWFWATREDVWEVKAGPVRTVKPQLEESFLETALDDPLASPLNSPCQKRKSALHPVHPQELELPPMSIHPRRGDLSALHDAFCIQIDRTFVNLPMWTIAKTLWMHDVHLASQQRMYADDAFDVYDETESESDPLDTAASSVMSSDDSDATLVDSETESELSLGGTGTRDQEKCFALSRYAYSSSRRTVASSSGKVLARRSSWATDWYRRWECMIEISHRGHFASGRRKFFINQDAEETPEYS
ncbi:hypothetical protein P691DRAFT_792887 [Macrolepiota fuliginosa MF-IS2]|uniref:Uncharacterized protein n=1 Tax=Macrolepiota fuliginosa MF-IS2 TaxID=1400762 RepID=A0A9P5XEM7_9AGAR|nr:hypothetical protein P691DRAFT_792887 [Macrolepiota fuliginosa MF-IS2]